MAKHIKENIVDISFSDTLSEKYLAYALSTIKSRSLPDVRDGLKPVHRRLLFAMLQLKLDPKTGFKKCARIIGDVIGKYHPHGELSVYDALVRMAQQFSSRYPLVDGQGNFGSIDGDNQAAMRYTEARLTEYAVTMLADIDKDTVDFRPNYDGSEDEPVVLPNQLPNLLANGTEGIAVGMATSVPPHNVLELCDASIALIETAKLTVDDLMQFVKGPDFPTGGTIIESQASILQTYKTGRGSFRLRAKWKKEELERGQYQIVIYEIPYQVNKRTLIEKLASLYTEKKLPFIETFQDMSAEDIRIIIEPKTRNIPAESLMESLFKLTDLEVRFHLNMNVLDAKSTPQVMDLKQVLTAFIAHRLEVTERRLRYRLGNIESRLEILHGLLIVYLNLDEVIRIIREEDDAKAVMMKKWKLTDNQVEAILNTKLRSLRKLEEMTIKKELADLEKEKAEIEATLASDKKMKNVVKSEIKLLRDKFSKNPIFKRLTNITNDAPADELEIDKLIEKEPLTVTLSEMGWIRAQKGHKLANLRYKEGDSERFVMECLSTDKISLFSDAGKFYSIAADKISRGKGDGEPIKILFGLGDEESIINALHANNGDKYLLASDSGRGFIIQASDTIAQVKVGKQALNVEDGAAIACIKITGEYVISVGENRRLLIFKVAEIPLMKKGKGVTLQKFKSGKLSAIQVFSTEAEFNTFMRGAGKNMAIWLAKRGSQGRIVLNKLWFDK